MLGYNAVILSNEEMNKAVKIYLLNSQTHLSDRLFNSFDTIKLRRKGRFIVDINRSNKRIKREKKKS